MSEGRERTDNAQEAYVPDRNTATDEPQIATMSVPEAERELGLSRNAAYAAAKRKEIPTIRFNKLLRVPKAAFKRMLEA